MATLPNGQMPKRRQGSGTVLDLGHAALGKEFKSQLKALKLKAPRPSAQIVTFASRSGTRS